MSGLRWRRANRSARSLTGRSRPDMVREILSARHALPRAAPRSPGMCTRPGGSGARSADSAGESKLADLPRGEPPDYHFDPPDLSEPYSALFRAAASLMYGSIGIARDDMAARQRHLAQNWEFFGAPVGLIFTIHRHMEPGQCRPRHVYAKRCCWPATTASTAVPRKPGPCGPRRCVNVRPTPGRSPGGLPNGDLLRRPR